jgi:hypothetical protein
MTRCITTGLCCALLFLLAGLSACNGGGSNGSSGASATSYLIADHTSADAFDAIPDYWIQKAKNDFRLSYGHSSHGSQITTGLQMITGVASGFDMTNCAWYLPSDWTYAVCDDFTSSLPADTLSYWHRRMTGAIDLGNPDRTAWEAATRDHLEGIGSDRNLIMWSWCGQVSNASEAQIQIYLDLMSGLEADYPNVTFVYMTGHLDGGGPAGSLYRNNDQIRDYVIANGKVLFDFADIESWDPDGTNYPNETDACGWCASWCSSHACPGCGSCQHSHCFNCYRKGKAFWWMMAKLAGWE